MSVEKIRWCGTYLFSFMNRTLALLVRERKRCVPEGIGFWHHCLIGHVAFLIRNEMVYPSILGTRLGAPKHLIDCCLRHQSLIVCYKLVTTHTFNVLSVGFPDSWPSDRLLFVAAARSGVRLTALQSLATQQSRIFDCETLQCCSQLLRRAPIIFAWQMELPYQISEPNIRDQD
jgi:hypothetical protein